MSEAKLDAHTSLYLHGGDHTGVILFRASVVYMTLRQPKNPNTVAKSVAELQMDCLHPWLHLNSIYLS
jgi:hypothetical protein